jgi:hypothetical protein
MNQVYIFCEKEEDRHQLPQHLNSNDIECMTPVARQDFDYLSPDVIVPMANVAITLLNVILMYIQKKQNRKIVIKGERGGKSKYLQIAAKTIGKVRGNGCS